MRKQELRQQEVILSRLSDQIRFAIAWLTTSRELLRQGNSFRDTKLIRRARKWLKYAEEELEYTETGLALEASLM
jgi:hypothetical protein